MADPSQGDTPRHRHRVGCFLAVGCTSAAVHWSVVWLCVTQAGCKPLGANVAGWLLALLVSFSGHFRLTFQGHGTPVWTAAWRFFVVSLTGFCLNEAAYAVLLQWRPQLYGIGLATVLAGMAVLTYGLSRHWAFLRMPVDQ